MVARASSAAHAAARGPGPRIPRATYRLQLGADFTLRHAREVVPYLADLGISDFYLSPLFQARRSSTHWYDVTDYGCIDPRIGTLDDLRALHATLQAHGMGILLDVVPNHMGIGEGTNKWWMDVLEFGEASPYAAYFDIDWQTDVPGLQHRVLLPLLEEQYGAVLEAGLLRVDFERGAYFLRYHDRVLPIAPRSYPLLLNIGLAELRNRGAELETISEMEAIIAALAALPERGESDPERRRAGREWARAAKERLAALTERSIEAATSCVEGIGRISGRAGDARSFDRLDELLEEQYFRLASWRVAADELNYRRFFDINELAAIRVESPEVFADTHKLVIELVREGIVSGLRVDHPDGLLRPHDYFRRLQGALSPGTLYVVAEKILSEGEALDATWPVSGTTGYDFLADLNGVLIDRRARAALDRLYTTFTDLHAPFHEVATSMKKLTMLISFAGEVAALGRRLDLIAARHRHYRDFTRNSLVFALREIIAALRVYRTYVSRDETPTPHDLISIAEAVHNAKRRNPRTTRSVFDFVGATMTLQNIHEFREEDHADLHDFAERAQQVTGPVMAKGVEDTSFYVYNRLVALNEVGASPDRFGISVNAFHRANARRAEQWPHSLLATSTHDTKRSEDVRARIDVLTEFPSEWRAAVHRWAALNAPYKQGGAPDANDEYLLYQTLVGVWPADIAGLPGVKRRLSTYMVKAMREAKVHTSWIEPNEDYENATMQFIHQILRGENEFVRDVALFVRTISSGGYLNSLAQTLIKIAAPGVPDFYQGTELWDFSLVDPDNRRPVDFYRRRDLLLKLEGCSPDGLWSHRDDGWLKLFLTARSLGVRRQFAETFEHGAYRALRVIGPQHDHIIAFARVFRGTWVIAIAPRLLGRAVKDGSLPDASTWEGTGVILPAGAPSNWFESISSRHSEATRDGRSRLLMLKNVFRDLPCALLVPSSGETSTGHDRRWSAVGARSFVPDTGLRSATAGQRTSAE